MENVTQELQTEVEQNMAGLNSLIATINALGPKVGSHLITVRLAVKQLQQAYEYLEAVDEDVTKALQETEGLQAAYEHRQQVEAELAMEDFLARR